MVQLFSFNTMPRRLRGPSLTSAVIDMTSGSSVNAKLSSMPSRAFTAPLRRAPASVLGSGRSRSSRRLSTSSTAVTVSPDRVRVV